MAGETRIENGLKLDWSLTTGGPSATVLVKNGSTGLTEQVTQSSISGAFTAGSAGQIIYNNSGVLTGFGSWTGSLFKIPGDTILGEGIGGATRAITATGTATDVGLTLLTKGAGALAVVTDSYVLGNAGATVQISNNSAAANSALSLSSKGSGDMAIASPSGNVVLSPASGSQVNIGTVSIGGTARIIGAIGSATDIDISFTPKGVGQVFTNSDFNIGVAGLAGAIRLLKTTGSATDVSLGLVPKNNGSLSIFSSTGSFGSGTKVIFISDAAVNPSTNPTGGGILYSTGGVVHWRTSGGTDYNLTSASPPPYADNTALVKNNADNTKLAIFNAASLTTATTRTYTLPDANGVVTLLGLAQTFTAKQTFTPGASVSGWNSGAVASDPSTPVDADIWYNSTKLDFIGRINGQNSTLTRPEFITASGTTYNFAEADRNKVVLFTNASGCTATVPAGLSLGWQTMVYRASGSGVLTIASSGTLESTGTTLPTDKTAGSIFHKGSNVHVFVGATTGGAAGVTTEVQINSGGIFGGSKVFVPSNGSVTLGDGTVAGSDRALVVTGSATDVGLTVTTKGTGAVTLNSGQVSINTASSLLLLTTGFIGRLDTSATGLLQIQASGGLSGSVTGGDLLVRGGAAYIVGNNNGGNILLRGGTKNGSGLDGNIGLNTLAGSFGSGGGVIFIGDDSADPTTNPTAGGILYASVGALYWRGSNGTVTQLASA